MHLYIYFSFGISIHSLAWRKTFVGYFTNLLRTISIHSLAWRKTNCICIYIFRLEFQSTLSHGERHAIPPKIVQNNYYFNPLSRMEKDQMMYEVVSYNFNFNPLSRMEKDGSNNLFGVVTNDFNPLSRMEKDQRQHSFRTHNQNFNPLSRMEKDAAVRTWERTQKNFNPLSRMEKDSVKAVCLHRNQISIHSLAWRKTFSNVNSSIYLEFQSTLSHGERHA